MLIEDIEYFRDNYLTHAKSETHMYELCDKFIATLKLYNELTKYHNALLCSNHASFNIEAILSIDSTGDAEKYNMKINDEILCVKLFQSLSNELSERICELKNKIDDYDREIKDYVFKKECLKPLKSAPKCKTFVDVLLNK